MLNRRQIFHFDDDAIVPLYLPSGTAIKIDHFHKFTLYITWKENSRVKLSSFEFLIIKGSTTSYLMILIIVLENRNKNSKLKPYCISNIRR